MKIDELWVPAAAITEAGVDGDAWCIRQEARYRLKRGSGVKVFSRPGNLADFLAAAGLTVESRRHCIVNAGELVPGLSVDGPECAEFFAHSPFAWRTDGGRRPEGRRFRRPPRPPGWSGRHSRLQDQAPARRDRPPHRGCLPKALRAAVEREHVKTLSGIKFMRVNIGRQPDMCVGVAAEVAQGVADLLGWDEDEVRAEVAADQAFVRDNFAPRSVSE